MIASQQGNEKTKIELRRAKERPCQKMLLENIHQGESLDGEDNAPHPPTLKCVARS